MEAYNTIKDNGMLSRRRWEAYEILFHHGPMTSNEVFQRAKLHGNPNYRHNTNARMTELRSLGVIEEVGVKNCSITGHKVILWEVTNQLPQRAPAMNKLTVGKLKRLLEEACVALDESGNLFASAKARAIREEVASCE